MEYDFNFILRSDDYHPVSIRLYNDIAVAIEVMYLDNTSKFLSCSGNVTPEGTGNVCTFTARIESDNPSSWLALAQNYARLRYLEGDVSIVEHKEPESLPIEEETETSVVEENVTKPVEKSKTIPDDEDE
jgi:hypothetical protein